MSRWGLEGRPVERPGIMVSCAGPSPYTGTGKNPTHSLVRLNKLLLGSTLLLIAGGVRAQCPQLYDYYGVPSSTPYWYSCSGNNFTLLIATPSSVGSYTIDWGDGSPVTSGGVLVPPMSVSHVYPATVDTFVVTFMEVMTGCIVQGVVVMEESTSASIQIPIGGLTQICAPQAIEFINSSTNVSPNTVFTWDFGDASTLEVYDYTNLGQTITHVYQQGTVSCETTVTLSAENTCNTLQGGPSVATFNPIRVWDLDSANITPSATLLCYPDTVVTFLNTTQRNCLMQGNIYQRFEYWNFGDYWGAGTDSIIDWAPWPPTFPHTIAYPGIGTYTAMLLDSNYCGIDTAYVTIQIVPPPSVSLTLNPDTICAGETAFFDETTTGGANYFGWNFDTGSGWQWSGPGDQAHTYNNPGTYVIGYAASIQGATAGCADTAYVTLVVLPTPTAQFTLSNNAACDSLTTGFTDTSIGAVAWFWDFGDGTFSASPTPPPHFYGTVGDFTVTLTVTNANNCTASMAQLVHIYDPPVVAIGAQNVCVGDPAQFTDLTTTASGNPVVQWAWDFGDGGTDTVQNPSHLYPSAGPFLVTLTATTPYCSGTGTQPVVVEAKPTAGFTPSSALGCSPVAVTFTNTSIGAASYAWDFGDGSTSTSPSPTHTFVNVGTIDSVFTVTLIASTAFGCSDTALVDITVAPMVVAQFIDNAVPGCAPLSVDFTNQSTGANSYFWDFDDGTTSTAVNPTHLFTNTTFFLDMHDVVLIAYSPAGCTDTAIQQVVVYPEANFTFATVPDSGCSPLTLTFPSVVGAVVYDWDFGDGTTGSGPTPTHTYINNTTNNLLVPVTLVAANAFGCTDTTTTIVTVYPNPTAQFLVSDPDGCHPLTASLVNLSTGGDSYHWDYGDGQSADTLVAAHDHTWYNYAGPGANNYTITLTAITNQGCVNTTSTSVQVFPLVTAAFVADSAGCSPLDPGFMNVSSGASSYQWFFDDGTASALTDPPHTYVNNGLTDMTFDPLLIATSSFGCADSATMQILVHPAPIAQFVPSTLAGCTPLDVIFQDLTIGAVSLDWDFGDGTSLAAAPGNQSHTYISIGTTPDVQDVELIATSAFGCTDTATAQITIYPPITAAFTTNTEGCSPLTVTPTDLSTGAAGYLWDMGDGTVLTGPTPTYTYVNTTTFDQQFTITLITSSAYGCTDTAYQVVTVYPVPSAAFIATPFSQVFPNATVAITNNTLPGSWTYFWDFGDGSTSVAQDPLAHTYGTWGIYTIKLVVSTALCSDTVTQDIEIVPPQPTAGFTGGGDGCAPLTVSFTNTSLGGLTYQWNFGDGGTSSADNPVYTYNVPGTYTVTLTAFGLGGAVNTVSLVNIVVVHPQASAFFVLQPDEVLVPSQPVFTYNLSANASSYWWDFGDGSTSTEENPVHYYASAGVYDVMLIANNEWNCPDTFLLEQATTAIVAGDIAFPNAFTPGNNGPTDGVYDPTSFENDFFFPIYEGVENYQLQVFDRWGELVFESSDVRKGWDGYYRGDPAKQDVYAWKAWARFSDGHETTLSGDVTLLR